MQLIPKMKNGWYIFTECLQVMFSKVDLIIPLSQVYGPIIGKIYCFEKKKSVQSPPPPPNENQLFQDFMSQQNSGLRLVNSIWNEQNVWVIQITKQYMACFLSYLVLTCISIPYKYARFFSESKCKWAFAIARIWVIKMVSIILSQMNEPYLRLNKMKHAEYLLLSY